MENEQRMERKVLERVKEESRAGKLSCRKALELAEALGVPPAEVGRAADESGVWVTVRTPATTPESDE